MNAGTARPLRVLHLIEALGVGGAEQLLLSTVRALDPRRVVSLVACLFDPLELAPEFERMKVPVFPLKLRGRLDWRRGVLGLARLLREQRIDLVHTHLFYANFYGRVAAWLARTPATLTTLHSLDYTYQNTGRLTFKLRKLADRLTATYLTAAHVAVSRAVQDDYRRHLGLDKIEVLYNYIDLAPYHGDRFQWRHPYRKHYAFGDGDFVVLNIGRLHPEKGQRVLVTAMPEIRGAIPSAKLVLVGAGSDEPVLRTLAARLGVSPAITFAGCQSDVRGMLAMADVFVLPSNLEGLPVSLLEAMAAGLPVVATRVGGTGEVVEDGVDGLLVPPADPQAIAQAVIRLYRDPELRERFVRHGRATVEQRFSVTTQVPQLERLYDRVIVQRSRIAPVAQEPVPWSP